MMKPVTAETDAAVRALLKSLGVTRVCRYDMVRIFVGGTDLNNERRYVDLQFAKNVSDPLGYWQQDGVVVNSPLSDSLMGILMRACEERRIMTDAEAVEVGRLLEKVAKLEEQTHGNDN